MEGLKPWAKAELHRQWVADLTMAQAATECLMDYNSNEGKRKDKKSGNQNPNRDRSFRNNGKGKNGRSEKPTYSQESKSSYAQNYPNKGKAAAQGSKEKIVACFLCNGAHRVADCPHQKALNVLQASLSTNKAQDQGEASSSSSDDDESVPQGRVGTFHLVNAVTKKKEVVKPMVGKHCSSQKNTHGLMFVDVRINGKLVRALVDTGATHNFIAGTEVPHLVLVLEKDASWIKAVNSEAQPIDGVAKSVPMKLGTFEGRMNFTAVPMDDFQAILGLEFLRDMRTVVMPYNEDLCMMGDRPHLI